jgi:hypothetical protein
MAQQNDDGGADAAGTANEQEPAAAVTDAQKAAAATAAKDWETGAAGDALAALGEGRDVGRDMGRDEGPVFCVDPGLVDRDVFGNLRPDANGTGNPSAW